MPVLAALARRELDAGPAHRAGPARHPGRARALAGPLAPVAFLGAATIGIALLETVNHIEHYGLVRVRAPDGRHERVRHRHSWHSDHPIGRSLPFELSRHSDHHHEAGKHYRLLDSHGDSPQMPTGHPGMMLLAMVPPLWFRTMNPRIDAFQGPTAGPPARLPARSRGLPA